MSETKHTPEPWEASRWKYYPNRTRIFGPLVGDKIQLIGETYGEETNEANADRIVECVNAMEGIDNPVEFISNIIKCLDIEVTPELLEKTVREEAESLSK